jgi:hypothetical protein
MNSTLCDAEIVDKTLSKKVVYHREYLYRTQNTRSAVHEDFSIWEIFTKMQCFFFTLDLVRTFVSGRTECWCLDVCSAVVEGVNSSF